MDQLIKQNKIEISEKNTFLAGFGSGALNIVAINACFREQNPLSWHNFFRHNFLKEITNEDVFIKVHPIHWSTLPLRKTILQFLKDSGFKKISDLPFSSCILASSLNMQKTIWIQSNSKKAAYGDLSDVLMATSAIPVLFPTQQINSTDETPLTIPEGSYAEGAINGIFKKFKKHLRMIVNEKGAFDEMYIISPSRNFISYEYDRHNFSILNLDEREIFDDFLSQISMEGFMAFLSKLQRTNSVNKFARKIFVCMPETEGDIRLLEFHDQERKYNTVHNWFENNPDKLVVELGDFIRQHSLTGLIKQDELYIN